MEVKLDLRNFIAAFFPEFKVDGDNDHIIKSANQWCNRNPKFEDEELGRYLDKGLLIMGPVGTGKTELMRIIRFYLQYLQSHYIFKVGKVWEFADLYKRDGAECFKKEHLENRYYDELALTDEQSGQLLAEQVQHYGNKILVGEMLIRIRYEAFKNYGYQTHFTSNCSPDELRVHYGARAFSRLSELCNFLQLRGKDRRPSKRPTFYKNVNQPKQPLPTEITQDEYLAIRKNVNNVYQHYLKNSLLPEMSEYCYNQLEFFKIEVATEAQLNIITDIVRAGRKQLLETEKHEYTIARTRQLKDQYRDNKLDTEERGIIWSQTKREALKQYFDKKKEEKATVIFEL